MTLAKVHTPNGTNGVAVATTDTTSGDAYSSLYTTGGTFTYDNTHVLHSNPVAFKAHITGASDRQVYAKDSAGATKTKVYFRKYVYLSALPSTRFALWRGYSGSTLCADLGFTTAGKLDLRSSDGSTTITGGTGAVAVSAAAYFRLEFLYDVTGATGAFTASIFNTVESGVASETLTGSSTSIGSGIDSWRWAGNCANNGAGIDVWTTDLAVSYDANPGVWTTGESSSTSTGGGGTTETTTSQVTNFTVISGLLVADSYAPAVS